MLLTNKLQISHCGLTLTLNRKHIFINNAKTWSNAQKFCRENYADLSTIDSQEELLRFKNDSKNQTADSTHSWVGLSKPSANGKWVWSDGSEEISMTWRTGQPDNPNISLYKYTDQSHFNKMFKNNFLKSCSKSVFRQLVFVLSVDF
uniref:C-type lectin domain-containing protein n=1 Tax=Sinocyclocheilus grahami TaxID=75366 RepID=A0A672LM59_SINGR